MAASGRVTLADVAAEAGVSVSSVSNVMRNQPHIRESVRERVQAAVDRLGYRPLAIGQNLRSGRTGVVSLAIPDFAQPYFAEIARDAVSSAGDAGMRLVVQQTDNAIEREREVAGAWNLGTSDGLVFSPSVISDEEIEARRGVMPLVLLGEHSKLTTVDRVGIDSVAVARLATRHLIDRGRSRIAMIGEKTFGDRFVVSEREDGYLQALQSAGLVPPVPVARVYDWTRAEGDHAVDDLVRDGRHFDAVFCANDLLAVGAIRGLRRHGFRIPEDVAVVGVDDIEESAYAEPPLTTIRIDRRWMIAEAISMLQARLNDAALPARQVFTPHELVIRESSGRK